VGILSSIESILERLFEAPVGRLFGARLQPVTLAKRLERAMDTNRTFGAEGILVPNHYDVHLNPADYAAFESYRGSLEDDLAHGVLRRAREERYTLLSRPRVQLLADRAVARGDLRVASSLVDERGTPRPAAAGKRGPADTMVFDRPERREPPPPRSAASAYLLVATPGGQRVRFDLGAPLISIGRGADNDVILDDGQVSRHHCQLRLQHGAYSLADLGSLNGSYVNGQRVDSIALGPGDVIQLGGTRLEFQVAA
jgi:hypothetical protein